MGNKIRHTSKDVTGTQNEYILECQTEVQVSSRESSSDLLSHRSGNKNECNSGRKHEPTSKPKKFKCDDCAFETKYDKSFRLHQLLHKDPSEVQMYQCDKCVYKTKYKHTLKRHQIRHIEVSEFQMYHCDTCGFKTKYEKSIKSHLLKHK